MYRVVICVEILEKNVAFKNMHVKVDSLDQTCCHTGRTLGT